MKPYTQQVVQIIQGIPEGRVMTYGQVAEMAGNRRGARQVVRILHTLSGKYNLPWHRVVNAKGEIAFQDEEARHTQTLCLKREGIVLNDRGRIDLGTYRFNPWEE
ncbi:MGMT family protein [Paenibacillus sp. FJAT-26967]|uniref:MGMT family protein n=1 Tax=Paenibacillus sp. FJAT-26967 TaxID=1729690 RepID=UPI0008388355|nr:MGMT family protein [Paenibacillus sp. FJAT-26967]